MIILMAGLPGAGKSFLARSLAPVLDATLLDRDEIRNAIFPRDALNYSSEQNAIATQTLLAVAEYLAVRAPSRTLILDGRPMAKMAQIETVAELAERTGHALRVLLCTAPMETIEARLTADAAARGELPLDDRLSKLHDIAATFQPIESHHLMVDTTYLTSDTLASVVAWLAQQAK